MLENSATRTHVFETNISQLDALLKDGGIVIPDNPDSPGVSVLIKGQAGAGKSTLSMLMAAKCAQDGGPALYCALEQSGYSLKRLSRCLDVDQSGWHWTEEVKPEPEEETNENEGVIYLTGLQSVRTREGDFRDYLELLAEQTQRHIDIYGDDKISIIIIDSLNVFGRSPIDRLKLEELKKTLARRNRILIFIGEPDETQLKWDRLVDLVIALGNKNLSSDYFLRTITIEKARFQNHILGSHVVKIKGKRIVSSRREQANTPSADQVGFFIYPSLHYHLSVAIERGKRLEIRQDHHQGAHEGVLLKTGFEALDTALKGGIKRGTMTAIPSNISYVARGIGLSFLAQGVLNGERSLYLSLQDDPKSIIELPSEADISDMVTSGNLVIEGFRPGFISAEEFVDRIISAILDKSRLNATFQRVVFDDVRQVGLRFPLLETAPVFLPTLMDIFKLYDMTALFLNTTIPSSDLNNPSKDDLYDLVNTVIEVKGTATTSDIEAVVQIRKIAEQFYTPQQLRLKTEPKSGGRIEIKAPK